jgi:hypothetical protein
MEPACQTSRVHPAGHKSLQESLVQAFLLVLLILQVLWVFGFG